LDSIAERIYPPIANGGVSSPDRFGGGPPPSWISATARRERQGTDAGP